MTHKVNVTIEFTEEQWEQLTEIRTAANYRCNKWDLPEFKTNNQLLKQYVEVGNRALIGALKWLWDLK